MSKEKLIEIAKINKEHAVNGTMELVDDIVRIPASNYYDQERWQKEIDFILSKNVYEIEKEFQKDRGHGVPQAFASGSGSNVHHEYYGSEWKSQSGSDPDAGRCTLAENERCSVGQLLLPFLQNALHPFGNRDDRNRAHQRRSSHKRKTIITAAFAMAPYGARFAARRRWEPPCSRTAQPGERCSE